MAGRACPRYANEGLEGGCDYLGEELLQHADAAVAGTTAGYSAEGTLVKTLNHLASLPRPFGYRTVEDYRAGRRTDFEFTADEHRAVFVAAYRDAERCTGDAGRCRCAWHRRPAKIDIANVGAVLDAIAVADRERNRATVLAEMAAAARNIASAAPDLLPAWTELMMQESQA